MIKLFYMPIQLFLMVLRSHVLHFKIFGQDFHLIFKICSFSIFVIKLELEHIIIKNWLIVA